jgi:anti-sigma factor RsiW
MIDNAKQRSFMTRYLLGEVSAQERAEYEDKYLSDDDVFQELVALENELIDRYILGELSPEDRKRFERSFLSHPERRETVEIARSLLVHSASAESMASQVKVTANANDVPSLPGARAAAWTMQISAAVIVLMMTAGVAALLISNRRLGNQVERLQAEQARILHENDTLRTKVEQLSAAAQKSDRTIQQLTELQPDQSTIFFTLLGDATRATDKPRELIIPGGVAAVSLRLIMARDSHARYSVSVKTAEGNLVWRGNNIRSRLIGSDGQEIALTLPSRLFHNGDYVIRITTGKENALDNVAGFTFRAIRR